MLPSNVPVKLRYQDHNSDGMSIPEHFIDSMEDMDCLPAEADIRILLYAPGNMRFKEWQIENFVSSQLSNTIKAIGKGTETMSKR